MSDPARTPERMDTTANIRTAWRSAGFCSMQWLERPVRDSQIVLDVRARRSKVVTYDNNITQ